MVYMLDDVTSSRTFYPFPLCLVICDWSSTLILSSINRKMENKSRRKIKNEKGNKRKLSPLSVILTLSRLQVVLLSRYCFYNVFLAILCPTIVLAIVLTIILSISGLVDILYFSKSNNQTLVTCFLSCHCCRLKTLELVMRINLVLGWHKRTR